MDILEQTLKNDVKPALGCTEPVTIALAAFHAVKKLGHIPETLSVKMSTNLFKNAMEVGIPGTQGRRGIALAAALGCFSPHSEGNLTLLEGITEEWLSQAISMVTANAINIAFEPGQQGLFVEACAKSGHDEAKVTIAGSHENIVRIERNGEVLFFLDNSRPEGGDKVAGLRKKLAETQFSSIYADLSSLSEEVCEFLLQGVRLNEKIALTGLQCNECLGIGNAFQKLIDQGWMGNDVINRAKTITSAAVDARMSGCNLAVMTSAGSGNQGLTITLPLSAMAEHKKCSKRKLAESIALAHAVTSILKHHTGTLSAMCGCVVCSGIGLTAGLVNLLEGDLNTIFAAVNNMVGSITGVICDGAKVGCAVKLVCAVDAAFQAAFLALNGVRLPYTNGVLGLTVEESLRNIGRIAAPGMIETDDQILEIMIGKPLV